MLPCNTITLATMKRIFFALVFSLLVTGITSGICISIMDAMRRTGGMITASDILGLQIAPYAVGLVFFYYYLKLTAEK